MNERDDTTRKDEAAPPAPVDVVDGIPDRSPSSPAWKIALIVLIFAAWVAVLVYVQLAGRAGSP